MVLTCAVRRSLALGLATIAACMGLLLAMPSSIIPLFAGRAASMSAFTVLYIFTPEVLRSSALLDICCMLETKTLLQHCLFQGPALKASAHMLAATC